MTITTRQKQIFLLPFLCLIYAGFANAQTYCASKGNLPWEQWIGNVWVSPGTFHNASSKEGYADFTTRPSVPLQRGMSNLFVLTPKASWGSDPKNKELYWRVWIDFNGDGDFADASEQVINGHVNVSDGIFFDNEVGFSVPSTARLGSTRLRVALKQGAYPEPCETFERGEVEDYTAVISDGNTPSNLDLSIVALPTSIVEPNAGNLTSYPLATALKLKYSYTISNATAAQADSLLYFDVYISRDSVLSNDDYRRFRFGGAMGLNRTAESEVFVLPYPNDLPNGKYYVFIKIDGADSFAETNKNNNVSAGIPYVFYGLLCNNAAQSPWGDWISNVKFNTLNNSSDKILFNNNGQFTAGYSAFIALNTSVERGKTYPLSITSSASWSGRLPNHRYTAWIDFNGDGDFDDIGEKVYQGLGTNGVSLGNITIPNSATLGKTIMRVAVRNGAYAETCTTYTEGEVEDYFVQITEGASANNQDIAVSIAATPSVFTKYTPMNFIISAKNNGNQAFTNVKIEFKFPVNTTNGGTATPSVGTWQEWCVGGVQCFTWTIPTFAANSTATLNIPIYVINPTPPMLATAKLLSSTPTDGNAANNTTTISINQAAAPTLFAKMQPTQLIPVVIQTIMPNPSENDVIIDLESLSENEVVFDFADAFGKVIKTENRKIERGFNRLLFELGDLPQGIYFLSPSTSTGRNVPIKFVKL